MTALTLSAVLLIAALAAGCAFGGAVERGGEGSPMPEETGSVWPEESAQPTGNVQLSESAQPAESAPPTENLQPADSTRYFFSEGMFLGTWDAGSWRSAADGGFTLGELFDREYFTSLGERAGTACFYVADGPGGFDDPAEVQRLLRPYGVIDGDCFVAGLPGALDGEAAEIAVPDYGFYASFDGQSHPCVSSVPLTAPALTETAADLEPAGELPLLQQAGVDCEPERMACTVWDCDVDGDGAAERLTLAHNVVDESGYLVLEEGDPIFYALLLTDDGVTTPVTLQIRDYTDDVTAHFIPGEPVAADLDGDGMCEVILRHREWEWGHISVFSLADGQWTEVLRGEYGM